MERYSENNFHGICVIIPAPSPDTPSPPHAPRCSMQSRAWRPCWRTLWVPNSSPVLVLAIKPTPHASRSRTNGAGPSNMLVVSPSLRGKAMLSCVLNAEFAHDDECWCCCRCCCWLMNASLLLLLLLLRRYSPTPR